MPWNDASQIRVGSNGQVYFAPVGTALPTTPTGTLNSAFTGTGFITEEGVGLSVSKDINEIMSWQSRQATRRELVAQEVQATFALQQWNEENVPFAMGGGVITTVSGGYRYDLPLEADALQEKSVVIDALDGPVTLRFVFPRGNVIETTESAFKRDEASVLPVTFKALEVETGGAAMYMLTDSPDFATGS